ncbi:5'/3'-nucleotidase SurE [Paracoccaceae bacterium GXU_MW_L88]
MRILVTNDDGISAPGLEIAEAIAHEIGDDVWTIAPAFEQSGVGHCISYTSPVRLERIGPRRFAGAGTPADCVLLGIHELMKDNPPDLILSGVNAGNNAAQNAVYSGTLGAAMEGALQHVPAIALSQFYGPENRELENRFEPAAKFGVETVRKILDANQWGGERYHLFYNVNFPPVPASGVKGTMIAPQGYRQNVAFSAEHYVSPNRREFVWLAGGPQHKPTEEGSDAWANLNGYISVTPCRADLTAHDMLDPLKEAFGQ